DDAVRHKRSIARHTRWNDADAALRVVRLHRDLVQEVKAAHLERLDLAEPEVEEDRLLRPLVDDPLVAALLGDPHLASVEEPDPAPGAAPERGFVLGVFAKGVDGEEELAELRELARTAGVVPVSELVQHREHLDPRTFVGKGKLAELKSRYAESDAEVLIVDEELTPTQQRTLEDALKSRVVDRTQLIL